MTPRLYTLIYATTLLLSAALLFSVQPMFSKMILPLLGGTPQVWNTAMLFFQVCLLGGYAYAHGTTRFLSMRAQAVLHIILLGMFTVVLPFAIPDGWQPPAGTDPTLWQLSLMAVTVGGPFFVLAGSAPMLQRWFAGSDHKDADNPYFLYGASNLGSMTSLLAYPFLIEPFMNLSEQASAWQFGYFGLIAFTALSALLVWRTHKSPAVPEADTKADVTWAQRLLWIGLSFIPSSLMLGVTTYITTDIASAPLLWILPLALYVGTFILVFARKPLMSENLLTWLFAISLLVLLFQLVGLNYMKVNVIGLIAIHLSVFFFAAMVCHTALANARPHASRLTEFYLLMSFGGALGGVFNAIIAPQFFVIPLEYPLVLALAIMMRYVGNPAQTLHAFISEHVVRIQSKGLDALFTLPVFALICVLLGGVFAFGIANKSLYMAAAVIICAALLFLAKNRWLFAAGVISILMMFPPSFDWGQHDLKNILHQERNFFGVLKVADTNKDERILLHGTTNHGAQALAAEHRMTPLSYYSAVSPIHDMFKYMNQKPGAQEVGVIGLGIGVTACFAKDDRHFDFYEIDAAIADVAENEEYFTYLSDCGSPYDIILGDGRLKIQNKPDQHYDLIVVDAFSSDNIPIHIITREAMQLYLSKIKDGGAVIMNISNNFLDLEPVLTEIAEDIGVPAFGRITAGGELEGTEIKYYPAHFFVLSYSENIAAFLEEHNWSAGIKREGVQSWSDQYSNIVSVFGNETAAKRFADQQPVIE